MAKRVFAKVKATILRWARESAGVSLQSAAKSLDIDEALLSDWESDVGKPSIPQLRKLAGLYKRPLSVFYLQKVPTGFQVVSDFRRPSENTSPFSAELTQEIRIAHQRRELALELSTDIGEKTRKFSFSATLDDDVEQVGGRLRKFLGIEDGLQKQFASDSTGRAAFNFWRQAAENAGVLVFQSTRISAQEASGFALSFPNAPVVMVNRKDAPTRRLFSLAHELAHLALQKSGVSDLKIEDDRQPVDSDLEAFCNRVAAAGLMPKNLVLVDTVVVAHGTSLEWDDFEIVQVAKRFGVSREAMLVRFLSLGKTSRSFYQKKRVQYADEYEKQREKEAARPPVPIPRNMPREALSLYGRPYISLVLGNYYQDRLTLSEVSSYLGLRTKHVEKLQSEMRGN